MWWTKSLNALRGPDKVRTQIHWRMRQVEPIPDGESGWQTYWGRWRPININHVFLIHFFWRKPYMSLYVKIKLLADPVTLEPHCNILQSHLDSSFQIRIPLCWYIKGMGPDEIPQRMNFYSKKSVMQFLSKTCGLVLETSHVVKRHCDTVAARCCMQCNVRRSTVRWGFTGHTLPLSSRVEQSLCVYSST